MPIFVGRPGMIEAAVPLILLKGASASGIYISTHSFQAVVSKR